MKQAERQPTELETLLEALCEDRLTSPEAARLEQLVLSSDEARWKYLTYLDLHGTLYWDTAGAGSPEPLSSPELPIYVAPVNQLPAAQPAATNKPSRQRYGMKAVGAIAACLVLVVVSAWQLKRPAGQTVVVTPPVVPIEPTSDPAYVRPTGSRWHGPPINLVTAADVSNDPAPDIRLPKIPSPDGKQPAPTVSNAHGSVVAPISSQEVVARINHDIESNWAALGLHPSNKADDAEWMRRLYLDLIGRVPTITEAEAFLADGRDHKRQDLIEHLLDDSSYVRNLTTKWTNLLIGRSSNPQVDRNAFQKFLRMSFAANRPWNLIVADLISAEGNNNENGATNFLIAHLNNDATPATAVTSRVFLGRQMQCNQCHNNPFDESKQLAYWELNSFFQQTTSIARQRRDPKTGRVAYGYTELVTQDSGGPTYFETQSGLMRVAYPQFNGHEVDPSSEVNRRRELARLMTYGDQPQLAAAFVNRMWEHFFGIGFTRLVDDMGPHSPASHPELLASLSQQFIQSGYDVKQLIRWICQSEPYQLSSRFSDANHVDDPSLGEMPAFSRMYVKPMTAEQTYDSFLTATKAHQVGAVDWTQAERNRQQWLQQFVITYDTDENEEAMAFDGSVGNALSLMNGPLIDKALDVSPGSFLGEVVRQKSSENDKIRALCLAALSRPPVPSELASMRKMVKIAAAHRDREHPESAYQDLFWALLNSNEFVMVR